MTPLSRLDCACGVSLIGNPQALNATYNAEHSGHAHRIRRMTPITVAQAVRLIRQGVVPDHRA